MDALIHSFSVSVCVDFLTLMLRNGEVGGQVPDRQGVVVMNFPRIGCPGSRLHGGVTPLSGSPEENVIF